MTDSKNNNLKPSKLVFLVDVSGSMDDANKLPLLKSFLKMLVRARSEKDRVALVAYAGNAGNFRFATAVAGFGMLLRQSENVENFTYANDQTWLKQHFQKMKKGIVPNA